MTAKREASTRDELREHHPWADGVHADGIVFEFLRHRLRELRHASLGVSVRRKFTRRAPVRARALHVENMTSAGRLSHRLNRLPRAQQRTERVRQHNLLQHRRVCFLQVVVLVPVRSRVVDPNVHTVEGVYARVCHRLDALRLRHVRLETRDGIAPECLPKRRDGLANLSGVARGDEYLVAARQEASSQLKSQAAR